MHGGETCQSWHKISSIKLSFILPRINALTRSALWCRSASDDLKMNSNFIKEGVGRLTYLRAFVKSGRQSREFHDRINLVAAEKENYAVIHQILKSVSTSPSSDSISLVHMYLSASKELTSFNNILHSLLAYIDALVPTCKLAMWSTRS